MANLPTLEPVDSAGEVRQFFDKYYNHQISFPTNQIDAVLAFFLKRGFDQESARSTGIVLLNQARIDNVSVFSLLDTLKALTDVQLSDAHNGLRALTVEATRAIDLTQNGMAHATQLVSLVLQANLKYTEVPVKVLYTPYSQSKGQSILNSINIALDLIWG